jgi:hypothetical protein
MGRWVCLASTAILLAGCPGGLDDAAGADSRGGAAYPEQPAREDSSSAGGSDVSESVSSTSACAASTDSATLALYTFDNAQDQTTIKDLTGRLDGTVVGSGVSLVDGKPGCGKAIAFSGSAGHVLIPSDAALENLNEGSVDFWIRVDGDGQQGVLSRDAKYQAKPGHLSILITGERRVHVRLQDTTREYEVSSERMEGTGWHHVGVCFGSSTLTLHLDGKQQDSTSTSAGIAGNQNPLVLGGLSWGSEEGGSDPVEYPLRGALDSVRISSTRRDFSQ